MLKAMTNNQSGSGSLSSGDEEEKLAKLQEKMKILRKHMRFNLGELQKDKVQYVMALRKIYGEGNEVRSVERAIALKINKSKHNMMQLSATHLSSQGSLAD